MKTRLQALLAVLVFVLATLASGTARAGDLDRSTPRRALMSFLLASEEGDFVAAATVLDLGAVPADARSARGPELAEQLQYVLERRLPTEPERLSDDPAGSAADGASVERVGAIRLDAIEVPIMLVRHREGAEDVWSISAATVARIPRLYQEHGPGWIEPRVPASLRPRLQGLALWQWLGLVLAALAAYALGRATTYLLHRLFDRVTQSTRVVWDEALLDALRRPSRFLLGVIAFRALLEPLALSAAMARVLSSLLGIVSIGAAGWIIVGLTGLGANVLEARAIGTALDAARSEDRPTLDPDVRAVRTQVRVLRRVINVAVVIVTVAWMLTQFEVVRNVGVSLLASAGVAGVVLGFAAQRTFSSLIAGIQLSFTQPIRIGDVVIVEKEYGTIEEVTLTFVVVKVWDERRLIVPMSRFLEQPFENWTKVSPDLHGTVFLFADWCLPIDAVRAEVDRIVEGHPKWDGRTKSVAVTSASERTIEVRVLLSAADADSLWTLRVETRERLVAWLQGESGGRYLPQVRLAGAGDRAPPADS